MVDTALQSFSMNKGFEHIAEEHQSQHDAKVTAFADEAKFAQQVRTAHGPGILIGGEVIAIHSSNPHLHVEALVRALRMVGRLGRPTLEKNNVASLNAALSQD